MGGPKLFAMAWRNIWRNKRRTFLTLVAIVFGIFLAVLFTGLGDDAYTEMINLAAKMGGGHVTVQNPDYALKPSVAKSITGLAEVPQAIEGVAEVTTTKVRITGQLVISTATMSQGAGFIAFDPTQESPETLSLLDAIGKGEPLAGPGDKGIIIGATLAEILELDLGKKAVFTMTDKEGNIITGMAKVKGILQTGSPALDGGMCLFTLGTMRKLLGYGDDEATLVAVFLEDQRDSAHVAAMLDETLGDDKDALTWKEAQPQLAGFIGMKTSGTLFMEMLFVIIIAAGIFNTIFVSVMERLREFGILMAIGFSPGRIFRLVMWESLWLGLTGLVTGVLVTIYPYWYLHTTGFDMTAAMGAESGSTDLVGVAVDPIMTVTIFPEHAVTIGIAAIVGTMLAGLYPAWKAGRVAPVETIKLV